MTTNQLKIYMYDYSIIDNCLNDKVILVTGAGDGIGKVAALTYAKLGATVILLGKTVSKLESVYDEIIAQGSPEPAIVPLDLKGATKQNYLDMASTIVEQFGQLDGALLNASMLGELTPFTQIHEQIWNDVLQVNTTSQFLLAQALIPILKKAPTWLISFYLIRCWQQRSSVSGGHTAYPSLLSKE